MRGFIRRFFVSEDGAVTVDWVVITAAVVGLSGVAYSAINGPTGDVANAVKERVSTIEINKTAKEEEDQ